MPKLILLCVFSGHPLTQVTRWDKAGGVRVTSRASLCTPGLRRLRRDGLPTCLPILFISFHFKPKRSAGFLRCRVSPALHFLDSRTEPVQTLASAALLTELKGKVTHLAPTGGFRPNTVFVLEGCAESLLRLASLQSLCTSRPGH